MGRLFLATVLGVVLMAGNAMAHCEIPCGIYDDELRLKLIVEDAGTIEKSMIKINELSASDTAIDQNQLSRWVSNKEDHANKIQDIVTQYFMTQRIKNTSMDDAEAYAKYTKELTLLHKILVHAMKAKQTVDVAHAEKIKELVVEFRVSYLGEHKHEEAAAPVKETKKEEIAK